MFRNRLTTVGESHVGRPLEIPVTVASCEGDDQGKDRIGTSSKRRWGFAGGLVIWRTGEKVVFRGWRKRIQVTTQFLHPDSVPSTELVVGDTKMDVPHVLPAPS